MIPSALSKLVRQHLLYVMRTFLMAMAFGFFLVSVTTLLPGAASGMTSALQGIWADVTPKALCDRTAIGAMICILLEGILHAYTRVLRPFFASA